LQLVDITDIGVAVEDEVAMAGTCTADKKARRVFMLMLGFSFFVFCVVLECCILHIATCKSKCTIHSPMPMHMHMRNLAFSRQGQTGLECQQWPLALMLFGQLPLQRRKLENSWRLAINVPTGMNRPWLRIMCINCDACFVPASHT
jgi:hypothetical protein